MADRRIADLLQKNVLITLVTTGGGARAQGSLWDIPGASAFLNGSSFTYSTEETDAYVGYQLDKYTGKDAAIALAQAAFMRSCETLELRLRRREADYANAQRDNAGGQCNGEMDWMISEDIAKLGAQQPIGVGLVASVASNRAHRGDHTIGVAVVTPDKVTYAGLTLEKGVGEVARDIDGWTCDRVALNAIFEAVGIDQDPIIGHVPVGGCFRASLHNFDWTLIPITQDAAAVRERFMRLPYFAASGKRLGETPRRVNYNLVPVTANPLHAGHEGMAGTAESRTGDRSVFLVTACEPPGGHKPAPTLQQMLRRAAMVRASNRLTGTERGIIFSEKALFVDMAEEHPGAGIVVGSDALVRALDPKWLGSPEATRKQFLEVRSHDTRFYVFGRDGLTSVDAARKAVEILGKQLTMGFVIPLNGGWSLSSTDIRKIRGW